MTEPRYSADNPYAAPQTELSPPQLEPDPREVAAWSQGVGQHLRMCYNYLIFLQLVCLIIALPVAWTLTVADLGSRWQATSWSTLFLHYAGKLLVCWGCFSLLSVATVFATFAMYYSRAKLHGNPQLLTDGWLLEQKSQPGENTGPGQGSGHDN